MTAAILSTNISEKLQKLFIELIYSRVGIQISPQKKTLMSNRLKRRLRALELDSYEKYYDLLRSLKPDHAEWDAFLQEITTHETYLFRDMYHWDWLRQSFLKDSLAGSHGGTKPQSLKIWSAACSTGDEVYTIAMCVADVLKTAVGSGVEILGTDIGVVALEQARRATYNARAVKHVPATYLKRYLTQLEPELWKVKPEITKLTRFKQHNLLEPMHTVGFDLVVIKNVLIYFDAESKKRVIDNIARTLQPGGLLLSGPAEGISGLMQAFRRISPWLHQKL